MLTFTKGSKVLFKWRKRDERRGEEKQRGKLSQVCWTLWRVSGLNLCVGEIKELKMEEMGV